MPINKNKIGGVRYGQWVTEGGDSNIIDKFLPFFDCANIIYLNQQRFKNSCLLN